MVCAWETFDPIHGDWTYLSGTPVGDFDVAAGRVGGAWDLWSNSPVSSQVRIQRAFDIPRARVVGGLFARFEWYYVADHNLIPQATDEQGSLLVAVDMRISGEADVISGTAETLALSGGQDFTADVGGADDITNLPGGWTQDPHSISVGVMGSTATVRSDVSPDFDTAYTIPAGFDVGGLQHVTVTLRLNVQWAFTALNDTILNPGEVWIGPVDLVDAAGVSIFCPPGGCDGCPPFVNVDCVGPSGSITDTFNRPVETDGWQTGTGGYDMQGAGPEAYTDGAHGILDTRPGDTDTNVQAGSGGPGVGLGATLPFDATWAFMADTDIDDVPPGPVSPIPPRSLQPSDFGTLAAFFGLQQVITSGGVKTTELVISIPSLAIAAFVPVSFVKNTWHTMRVHMTSTLLEVGYQAGNVAVPTTVYSQAASYVTAPVPLWGIRGNSTFDNGGDPPDTLRVDIVTKFDWIAIVGFPACVPSADAPRANQQILDELVGSGDGVTTVFHTAFVYNPASLRVEVATITSESDPSEPATHEFTMFDPPPAGALVHATYRVARF